MTKEKSIDMATQTGIVERGIKAYKAAKERGWVGLSDERLMEMPKQEQDKEWVSLMRGVRVEGNSVIITVNGYNDEARFLCKELIDEMKIYKEKNE